MAENPLITISIPAYNLGSYLPKTLDSILKQTYQNFEIILVDDASTDATADTIAKYAAKDNRIHAHYFQSHEGVSKARNYAIDNAKGDVIVFVDGDDLLEPQYLEVIARGLVDPSVDLVAVGYNWGWRGGSGSGNQFREVSKTNAYASINRRGGGFGGYTWNKGFKLSIIRDHQIRFDESLDLAEDLLFVADYIFVSHRFLFYPGALYTKVSRSNSIIHSATWQMRSKEQVVRQHIDEMARKIQP
ncbi:glycosyltransferase family 2 protein [Lentilactobacillus parakefiri]|uniref:Glycosyl transferase n=1 Tax=Lentilactobacillus parakefiri TaxID=152332 RepID=A0A269YJ90_9LACO|nr:glycosyltransferase family A protein [Lentilactobacillus parakefiri]PAK85624.1 glycosyl transferase [Lentilactobacillus parakefiri]